MIQFRWQDPHVTSYCANMECGKDITHMKHWVWSYSGEQFCSLECRKKRRYAVLLRGMFRSYHGWLGLDWGCIGRAVKFKLNWWFNPLEWLKRW